VRKAGQKPEQERRDQPEDCRERHDSPVEDDRLARGQRRPASDWNTRITPITQQDPKAAPSPEDEALSEELPDDASRAGAHRGSNRQLALTAGLRA
jgi:hypothetical protein